MPENKTSNTAWAEQNMLLRDPRTVVAQEHTNIEVTPEQLSFQIAGDFVDILQQLDITLLVTREYEHLVLALEAGDGKLKTSWVTLPHPSGMVYNPITRELFVAATRNPNQIFTFKTAKERISREDSKKSSQSHLRLAPQRSTFYPGCYYLHDLAFIDKELYGNSVGQNAIVRFGRQGNSEIAWWPKCIEDKGKPSHQLNYIQMNSIAAGASLEDSFFSASTDKMNEVRPGNPAFEVDKKGVIFSGRTREVFARGLTRPHSARLHDGTLFIANSGYGEVGVCTKGSYESVAKLNGWTRGLAFKDQFIFAGTSVIIPKFESYAPGVNPAQSRCGIQILDLPSGKLLGSLTWPLGNQIFALEMIPRSECLGFPHAFDEQGKPTDVSDFYYTYRQF